MRFIEILYEHEEDVKSDITQLLLAIKASGDENVKLSDLKKAVDVETSIDVALLDDEYLKTIISSIPFVGSIENNIISFDDSVDDLENATEELPDSSITDTDTASNDEGENDDAESDQESEDKEEPFDSELNKGSMGASAAIPSEVKVKQAAKRALARRNR